MLRPASRRAELDSRAAAQIGKYGLILAALSAAMLTVAIAIAAKLAAMPPGPIG